MAKRAALGGNFTAAGSWALVSQSATTGVEYLESESGTTTVTTAYSGCTSAVFSWSSGAPTIDGIGIRLANRTGTTGTISVHIEVATVEVAGTLVTLNTADLPSAATTDLNGGWIFFKFGSPVALANSTSYSVAIKTSSSTQVVVHTNGTAGNVSRYLRTATTGAPAAGDDFVVTGEYTGAGTSNTVTITMDETATTDYGAAATSLVTPALAVCSKGILRFGVAASTNYNLKVSGNIIVYSGGEFSVGTVGAEIPRNSSATVIMDCVSNVDFGIVVRNLGTFNAQGLSRTSGKNYVVCRLNADSPANDTVLDVDTDTGWLDNDEIAVAATSRTATHSESGALNGNASSTQLTVDGFAGTGGGLLNAHSGTNGAVAEVILLTRNVVIRGVSATVQTYLDVKATATVDCDWVQFKWFGSATTAKYGISVFTSSLTCSFAYCSFYLWSVTGSAIVMNNSAGTISITDCVAYTTAGLTLVQISATSRTDWVINNNTFILSSTSGTVLQLTDVGGTCSNNTLVGSSVGIQVAESGAVIGTISNNTMHSSGNIGLFVSGAIGVSGTISGVTTWRHTGSGVRIDSCGNVTISSLSSWGNTSAGYNQAGNVGRVVLLNPVFAGDSSFGQSAGILVGSYNLAEMVVIGGDFGTASGIKVGHTSADISCSNSWSVFRVFCYNCKFASTTEVSGIANIAANSFIASQKHDQTNGIHKSWVRGGTLDLETTITKSGGQSLRMLPVSASIKLESAGIEGGFKVAVSSGSTVTPSVYVRESAAYNGNRCRLIVKRNDAIGITADTVLDTRTGASDALWELMTGTTVAATDDGVMEFVVDCSGTAATGYVYVDSFTVT